LEELEEAIEDVQKPKKYLYEKRPLINLFDKVDISTTKNFHEINNIIQSEFNKSAEQFTIIEWYIAFNQLKEKAKTPK